MNSSFDESSSNKSLHSNKSPFLSHVYHSLRKSNAECGHESRICSATIQRRFAKRPVCTPPTRFQLSAEFAVARRERDAAAHSHRIEKQTPDEAQGRR
ncbi:hypothetical protein AVEN_33960-1 [Araneus ventricosus]|uniref:Uncharacterized protein n=1 Tax=Araneus ventricosus TaxID=182803 RepID=A0A4Y2MGA7_ARAVE|nr:hypothetical protein AVEN_33960-1 [Araneus ventricosus]